jgi:sugar transferase EpsL
MTSRSISGVYARGGKRVFDLALVALIGVPVLAVIAVIAIVVRFDVGSPVLFGQVRPGRDKRLFKLWKFRTMTDARDANGELLADEQRLTSFGRWLRSTSLDELPEFLNVLVGDMSLVGPRPLLVRYLDRYTPEQLRRHDVLPGVTGWAQVNGRNALSWPEKFACDCWYVDHMSLAVDVRILWRTLLTVVRREGITEAGHATMSEFLG